MDESSCARERHNSERKKKLANYKLRGILGSGSFSKVRLAQHVLTGRKVAIKVLNRQKMNNSEAEKVTREIKILRLFAHPHIIRLYEVIETRWKIYIVLEYMRSGDLFDYITTKVHIQEEEGRYLFQQIISGVEFCHLSKVVHRDLKPENILLDSQRHVKIADFGLSNVMRDGHFLKTSCGSQEYAAPEVLCGQLYAGPEVDVWSCGVILYTILCARLPFEADNLPTLLMKLKSGRFPDPGHLSPGARDLICQMLVFDPIKRITIPEIRQHPWFQDHLPRHLAVPAFDAVRTMKKIDEKIVQAVVGFGFNHNQVVESLRSGRQNQATVTYYLLLDDQLHASSCNLRAALPGSSGFIPSSLHPCKTTEDTEHSLQKHDYTYNGGMRQQLTCGGKWAPGLQFQARPWEIMNAVLKILYSLNVCWKSTGNYNMKCRWLPNIPTTDPLNAPLPLNQSLPDDPRGSIQGGAVAITSNNTVKFEMQLYKAGDTVYLLDLQRLHGSPFLFLEICNAVLDRLRVI